MEKPSRRKASKEDIREGENMAHKIKVLVARHYGENNPDIRFLLDDKVEITPVYGAAEDSLVGETRIECGPEDARRYLESKLIHVEGELCIRPKLTACCPVFDQSKLVAGASFQSQTLRARGGIGDCTFSLAPSPGCSDLPDWLTVDSKTGVVSAQPPAPGIFHYTITVEDSCGNKGEVHCHLCVHPKPTCCCPAIIAVAGSPLQPSRHLTGSGGTGGPYGFSAAGLPSTLTMDPCTGIISGQAPTAPATGPYPYPLPFTITVKDKDGNSGDVDCCFITVFPPLTVKCPTISVVSGWDSPSYALAASGGVGTYIFSLPSGSPTWLNLAGNTISIIAPPPAGGYPSTYSVSVNDLDNDTFTGSDSITVLPAVTVCLSGNPVENNPFTGCLTAKGGAGGPYSFSQPSGLPDGLNLAGDGMVTGKPTANGSSTVTVIVKDSACNTGPVQFSINVLAQPTATWPAISAVENHPIEPAIPASTSGGVGSTYSYSLPPKSGLPNGLRVDPNTGAISGTPRASGGFNFSVGIKDSQGNSGTGSGSGKVLTEEAAELARAQDELARAMSAVNADTSAPTQVSPHEIKRDLEALQRSVSHLIGEMDRYAPAAPPVTTGAAPPLHGFHVHIDPELLAQGNVRVQLRKPGDPNPLKTESPDPAGDVHFEAAKGAEHDLVLLLDEFPIQITRSTAE
ncbi:MAG: Ig domain-containing protein [Terracidiphilus sp.]|jgi:hypothetical protein